MKPDQSFDKYQIISTIRVALSATLIVVYILLSATSCQPKDKEMAGAIRNRPEMPVLTTYGASSLISDSGITRYKLETEEWLVFDRAKEPYWYFPQGVYVEKFDSLLKVEATVKADTAYFYQHKKLWKLIGNVNIMNLQDEHFTTSLLFWDQYQQKVYSDSFITIRQPERIIFGDGFESNEQMTIYTIRKTRGTFLINEE